MCVYVCMYIYIYTHEHTHTHTYIHKYKYVRKYSLLLQLLLVVQKLPTFTFLEMNLVVQVHFQSLFCRCFSNYINRENRSEDVAALAAELRMQHELPLYVFVRWMTTLAFLLLSFSLSHTVGVTLSCSCSTIRPSVSVVQCHLVAEVVNSVEFTWLQRMVRYELWFVSFNEC